MKLIFDATVLQTYPFAQPGFSGGTESYVKHIVSGLAERGHQVHVVAPDLERDEQRGDSEYWWSPGAHPTNADVVVPIQNLKPLEDEALRTHGYSAEHFVLLTSTNDPWLGDDQSWGSRLAAVPCMSQIHVDLLTRERPSITPEKCVITGLGVDIEELAGTAREYPDAGEVTFHLHHVPKVPGRMFFGNDPARGLWHLLAIFDLVRERIPEVTLHIGYDFDRQFEAYRWRSTAMAERMWQCKERIDRGEGIVNLGALTHDDLVREQLECQIHVHPSDPPNIGSQTHGLTQMELAAAGAALVLSDIESFPELFGECASLLPLPGCMAARDEEGSLARVTYQDWADEVVRILESPDRLAEMSRKSREVASQHTWPAVLDRWEAMLASLN